MEPVIDFFKQNTGRIFLFSVLIVALTIGAVWGMIPCIIYVLVNVVIFFGALVYRVYPRHKKPVFYNRDGKYQVFDIVYDRGSATRPTVPGVLKNYGQGWFIIYEDGFEWPLSDFRNIEMFVYQPK